MATGPITSWKIDGETMETITDFLFLGSTITSDGDCSHQIKRSLLFGRKAMTNLDSILESRDITLPTKVHLVKVLVFPVFMYGCESWTIKKVECWRIDAFELWCWRRLESPVDSKEIKPVNLIGNQSKIFFGKTQAEALVLWPPEMKSWLVRKDPNAGTDWRQEKGMRWLYGITDSMNMNLSKLREGDGEGQGSWHATVHGVTKSQTRLSHWTTTTYPRNIKYQLIPAKYFT